MITGIEGAVTLAASVHSANSGAKKTYNASVSTRDRTLVEITSNHPETLKHFLFDQILIMVNFFFKKAKIALHWRLIHSFLNF